VPRIRLDRHSLHHRDRPLWQDSELTAIINPEAVLFANPGARRLRRRLRAATAKLPTDELFWCAGCQGRCIR
jgi:conjugal transfer pilus assembly protein TraU